MAPYIHTVIAHLCACPRCLTSSLALTLSLPRICMMSRSVLTLLVMARSGLSVEQHSTIDCSRARRPTSPARIRPAPVDPLSLIMECHAPSQHPLGLPLPPMPPLPLEAHNPAPPPPPTNQDPDWGLGLKTPVSPSMDPGMSNAHPSKGLQPNPSKGLRPNPLSGSRRGRKYSL